MNYTNAASLSANGTGNLMGFNYKTVMNHPDLLDNMSNQLLRTRHKHSSSNTFNKVNDSSSAALSVRVVNLVRCITPTQLFQWVASGVTSVANMIRSSPCFAAFHTVRSAKHFDLVSQTLMYRIITSLSGSLDTSAMTNMYSATCGLKRASPPRCLR